MEVEGKNSIVTPCPPATGDMILRHEILTQLDFTNLVRTSVLSKPWRYLWITSSPNFIFDRAFFNFLGSNFNQSKQESRLLFAEQTLGVRSTSSCCLSLEKLVLADVWISSQRDFTCLDNCIRYAIACDLKRLELIIVPYIERYYLLPPTLFDHRCLVELKLTGCMLKSSSFPSYATLPCLKGLHIWSAFVDSVKLVDDLIASCPLIEYLALATTSTLGCNGVLKIDGIVNNPKLINVQIKMCSFGRIEIDAPGLQSFRFGKYPNSAPCDIVMSSCKNIRELNLFGVDNVSVFANYWFGNLSSRLQHLESMVLCECSMEVIKISSSVLKRLKIVMCANLVKVEIVDPNLCSLCYVGKNMIYFASNALDLSVDITLHPNNVDTTWFIQFVEFLGRFNTVKALTLYTDSYKNVIMPRELRTSSFPPLYNVKHLVLEIGKKALTQTIDEMIDGLLWLSPHPVIVSLASFGEKIFELTFLYDEIDGEGKYRYSFSSLLTCCRHCLKSNQDYKFRDERRR